MNANDDNRAKRLDDYIDALNSGSPALPETDDAELADLFATARDLHRLRATNPASDDVPSRLAVVLERELRADQTRDARRIESDDMSQFRSASSNGSLRPPDGGTAYPIPSRPARARQWAQFLVAAVAFVLIGVVLAQIIGGTGDDSDNVGGFPTDATPTAESGTFATVEPTPTATMPAPSPTITPSIDPSGTTEAPVVMPTGTQNTPTAEPKTETTPVVDPQPSIEPGFATLSVSPDYVTCESEVIARGMGFEPGTTVVLYGGPMFGDNFGPVSDDISVTEIGDFEVVIDVGSIYAQCRGAEIDQEGALYTLGAETGSRLSKPEFEGPSAMTAITFSSTAPDALKSRAPLPTCGIEVIRTETDFTPQGEPNVHARECFAAAASAGIPAEFASYVQTSDFAIETTIYRVVDAGTVEILSDSTIRERWEQYTCSGLSLPDAAPYQFQFETCGDTVAIE